MTVEEGLTFLVLSSGFGTLVYWLQRTNRAAIGLGLLFGAAALALFGIMTISSWGVVGASIAIGVLLLLIIPGVIGLLSATYPRIGIAVGVVYLGLIYFSDVFASASAI